MADIAPEVQDLPTPAEYQEAWRGEAEMRLGRGVLHEEIRKTSIRQVLARRNLSFPADVENRLFEEYFRIRYLRTEPFPEVRTVLSSLRERYLVGVISNGNSYADRIGLGDNFDAEFYAQRIGRRKPDPYVFHHVASALDVAPSACVMVGDSLEDDVIAPARAGWRSVHLDRDGVGSSAAIVVSDLNGVAAWLDTVQ